MNDSTDKRTDFNVALLKISDRDKLVAAIQTLAPHDIVKRCDAVDGEYDLIVLLDGSDIAGSFFQDTVRKLDGVEALELCAPDSTVGALQVAPLPSSEYVDDPTETVTVDKSTQFSAEAYVFVEVNPGRLEDVFRDLHNLSEVRGINVAKGDYPLILQAEAASFDHLDRLLSEKLRVLPGVLRVKQERVIKLFGM